MHTLGTQLGSLLGRILIGAIFLMSAIGKFADWSGTLEQMRQHGIVGAAFLLPGAVCLELLGGLSVLTGCKARWGAVFLIIFLIPTTLVFHDFWSLEGEAARMQAIQFTKNMAILGGLLYVFSFGSGRASIDQWLKETQGSKRRGRRRKN